MPTSPYTNGIMPSFGVTVPPGDALNTTDADIKGGLQPTFFADGCRFYVEAASVNGIISEILNAVNCMGLEYDPNRLDNLCLAIKEATQPPNAETIVASICAVQQAQTNLAECTIVEMMTALCNNDQARQIFIDCMFTNTLNMPEALATCICSDGQDNGAYAQAILSACLISSQADNQLAQGADGRLYVPPSEGGSIDTSLLWTIRVGVGQVYMVDTSKTGHEKPPIDTPTTGPVFIELASGLTGPGQFNRGKIDNENTSGNFPINTVTGRIALASSPMVGQTVHMLNTEEAILRPRRSGVGIGQLQFDQLQWHEHNCAGGSGGSAVQPTGGAGQFNLYGGSDSNGANLVAQNGNCPPTTYEYQADSQPVRTGIETRVKNVGVTAYMRIR